MSLILFMVRCWMRTSIVTQVCKRITGGTGLPSWDDSSSQRHIHAYFELRVRWFSPGWMEVYHSAGHIPGVFHSISALHAVRLFPTA